MSLQSWQETLVSAQGDKVEKKYWDKRKQTIKTGCPLSVEYNKINREFLKKATLSYATLLETNQVVSMEDIILDLEKDTTTDFFVFATTTKMAQIKATNKLGTYRRYEAVLSKLKVYTKGKLNMRKINYSFLQAYSLYLKDQLSNTDDTVSANLSVIRSIINEAINHGVYTDRNPFDQMKLKYTDNTKEKLTLEELKRLFYSPIPNTPSLQIAKDFFLACFLAEGTRAGDMVFMKKENMINDCLVFNQTKTGAKMVIPISSDLKSIIDKYQGKGQYLFPLLDNRTTVNEIIVNSRITYVNNSLKEVAKYCGIFKKLSTHVARHTYTDLALSASNGNIYEVQKALGHTSVKTTEIYSRNRVNYERKSLIDDILLRLNS